VLLRFSGALLGFAQALSLRRAIDALRSAGKPVAAWAERLDAHEYLVASAASRLWLAPVGELFLVGLRFDGLYLRGLLDRLDVKADVIRIGSHKSAAEHFTRDSMSAEEREQLEALIDDLFGELSARIAAGRTLEPAAVGALVDRGPFRAAVAAEVGLSDGCLYPDELQEALEALTPVPPGDRPGPRRVRLIEAAAYHALRARDVGWRPLFRELPRIAYVVAHGAIHRGSGARGIASDSVRRLLESLGRDDDVRGVVLRIDSPGGDGLASDLLWRAVSQLAREKPVIASMGDVAASGGYYVACAADGKQATMRTPAPPITKLYARQFHRPGNRRFVRVASPHALPRQSGESPGRAKLLTPTRLNASGESVRIAGEGADCQAAKCRRNAIVPAGKRAAQRGVTNRPVNCRALI
jgi:protease-4